MENLAVLVVLRSNLVNIVLLIIVLGALIEGWV